MDLNLGPEINYAYISRKTLQFTSSPYLLPIKSLPTHHSYGLPEEPQGFSPKRRARNVSYMAP
jgi:hypothetical protein